MPGPAQWARHLNAGYFLIWDLTKVVIAQAHGYCLAGGSELASYCDLFVVADDALIGYPPVRDMSPPDNCWFPWHLPMRKAKEMIFTGDPLTGKQAAEYGLANYSVPADELDEFTTKLAKRVALVPPELLALSKRQVNRTYEVMGIRTALSAGNDIMALNTRRWPVHQHHAGARACGPRSTSATHDGAPTVRRRCCATTDASHADGTASPSSRPDGRGYRAVMSDFLNKAKDAVSGLKDNPLLDKAEDIAEDKADDGGTIGTIADKADDVIDQIQGTKD